MRHLLLAAAGALALSAAPAAAVTVTFGGGASGTDPLGHDWLAQGSAWGLPGLGQGAAVFHLAGLAEGSFATGLRFTLLGGAPGLDTTPASADPFASEATTRFVNLDLAELWEVAYQGSGTVLFSAPQGSAISAGESFFVNVAFSGAVDAGAFLFSAAWLDGTSPPVGVPEPATAALLGLGLLGLGLARRRA